MPHVVIEAAGDLQALYQNFAPILQRTGGEILKIQEFYLSRSGKEALLEAVAIDQGTASNFFCPAEVARERHHGSIAACHGS